MRTTLALLATICLFTACKGRTAEERGREALNKIKESVPYVESVALEQKATPEQVTQAQEALKKASEYLGDVTGKLDAVTVNSIEAFQRSHGLRTDGILNEKTQRLLREVLAKKG